MLALLMIAFGALLKLIAKAKWPLLGLCDCRLWSDFLWHRCFAKSHGGVCCTLQIYPFGYDSLWSQLVLVLIGIIMAMLLQSSSASITATMAALVSGAD